MAFLSVKYLPRGSQGHLLPKLQTLTWRGDYTTELPFIHFFASPSLRTLRLGFYITSHAVSLLSTLDDHFPSLTCLYLPQADSRDRADQYLTAISRAIESRSCQGLECFHADMVDAPALRKLAHLPNLKELTVRMLRNSSGIVSSNYNGFLNLKTLRVHHCQIDILVSFFRSTQMPLESIDLQVYHRDHEPDQLPQSPLGDLTSLIASQPCQSSLTKLEMRYFRDPDGSDRLDSALNITMLRPLFVFSNLRLCHVDIEGISADFTFDLNDDALVELAASWPHLETLIFRRRVGWQNTSTITFNGLASLLRGCPLLKKLTLSMDATRLDYTSTGEGALNRRVKRLNLGDSIIEEPVAVALILADLFGSLEQVDAWPVVRRHRRRYQPLWDEVNSIVKRKREEAAGSGGSQINT
ncbi:hypothetical protein BJ138DRAFT_509060 [Hygrophoropsis aurantiaca]|uniref:Uncharacterized protein n=1 Tax=Hygrophoropsis aurantiaca TaxID=72124 RepID=A0ACB8A3X0_9AGAM|nr:hypothetical protein BJ138DRAFT_509060 [Hygrophoropsis aurantiaca]